MWVGTLDASTSYDHLSNKRIYKTTPNKNHPQKTQKKCPQVKPDWISTNEKKKTCTYVWSQRELMNFFLWWSPKWDRIERKENIWRQRDKKRGQMKKFFGLHLTNLVDLFYSLWICSALKSTNCNPHVSYVFCINESRGTCDDGSGDYVCVCTFFPVLCVPIAFVMFGACSVFFFSFVHFFFYLGFSSYLVFSSEKIRFSLALPCQQSASPLLSPKFTETSQHKAIPTNEQTHSVQRNTSSVLESCNDCSEIQQCIHKEYRIA